MLALHRAAITRLTIIADPVHLDDITHYVSQVYPLDPLVTALNLPALPATIIPATPDAGTADALRAAAPLPCHDTLVLASDFIAHLDLPALIAAHRASRSVCTVTLSAPSSSSTTQTAPVSKSKSSSKSQPSTPVDHYTVLSPDDRLLSLLHPSDVSANILPVRPALLSRYSRMHLRTDLFDPHVYIFHSSFLQRLLDIRPAISSVRFDLVPYLARRQHALARTSRASDLPLPGNDVRVSAHIVEDVGFITRANSVTMFREANLRVAAGALVGLLSIEDDTDDMQEKKGKGKEKNKDGGKKGKKRDKKDTTPVFATAGERTSVSSDCVVGENVTAGDRVSLKKSVVGPDCTLGTGVKLNGCVLMQGVSVADGANLSACVVGKGAVIGPNAVLKECRIAPEFEVDEDTEASDRDFVPVEATAVFDLSDDIVFC